MNQERPDETRAKRIVEQVLGISLDHADKNGGVDYLSPDGSAALEVTRVTDGDVRKGLEAWSRSHDVPVPEKPELKTCWLVFTSDKTRGLKTFRHRVHPLVAQLEEAGEDYFDDGPAWLHVLERRPQWEVYQALLKAGVERASSAPHHAGGDPEHVHRVIISVGSGGSASGSDEALELLCEALAPKVDNAEKLRACKTEARHLFVWIDGATPFAIERALSHENPSWDNGDDSAFGLPSREPDLDPAVTHLWVVHERSSRGWLWDGRAWQQLADL